MAANARKIGEVEHAADDVQSPSPRTAPSCLQDDSAPSPSPALILQQVLEGGLAEPEVKKWPPAVTLAFIVVTCGAFWALVAFGISLALN
jgi:hypothetical protein